ncbi:MAG TPA: DNA polymerase IV [Candidatus Omnitrophota bacterium]|nr:DNA polymerase IV [Candidatus Omnitrophota bacterium]HPS20381.1 DNA polymerase IV [Candidatus Omnitrophota bacterium]
MEQNKKFIVHVDMDAFFASVEERDHPEYKGKPVIVGADPKGGKGRGVVSACSYAARKYGIHSAMPISIAFKKCPDGIFLPVDMEKYCSASREVFAILDRFSPDIEPISVDEAFLDITGTYKHFGTPEGTCLKIKSSIKKETGLTASVGLAPNKMTAKIASDINKPDGFTVVKNADLLKFLFPLPIGKLWGIGEKSEREFLKMGIHTIGDLAKQNRERMISRFGKSGLHVWELANGIDEREVAPVSEIKSISHEHTFEQDTLNEEIINNTLMRLSEDVSRRLRRHRFKCRTITLKIRFSDFSTFLRSVTIPLPLDSAPEIYKTILSLLKKTPSSMAIRLLGVKTSNFLDTGDSGDLFENIQDSRKKKNIVSALDRIKDKYGEDSIGYRRFGS